MTLRFHAEQIVNGASSSIQCSVDEIQLQWTRDNRAELNEDKCKELRIDFSRNQSPQNNLVPVVVNNVEISVVDHATILGLLVSKDLKWNKHVDKVTSKLKQLNDCMHLITGN
jgi:hypothetical protein